ncbi:Anaphase-promoting complex subunit DOC1 [Hanseniaspora osmophila]|uniref:Anaphase-promoting complex subunit DOC1 n=1 Tax=Hanseniaspora osmophila TaxID=56408 RepID=A0A1E5R1T1_9ASCO|nr:Anaphase-promoting complex subunit DOC1 [Hanseniaspora osmophila]
MDYEQYLQLVDAKVPDIMSLYEYELKRLKENTTSNVRYLDEDKPNVAHDYVWSMDMYSELSQDAQLTTGDDPNEYIVTEGGKALSAEAAYERYMIGIKKIQNESSCLDVTNMVYWKASSSKADRPIDNIADSNPATFWQSDGFLPHIIEAHSAKKLSLISIDMFFSLTMDESYSPYLIKVYAGNSLLDLTFIRTMEVLNVNGWVSFRFSSNSGNSNTLECQHLKFIIYTNHQNGKDTHLRGIRLLAKKNTNNGLEDKALSFTGEQSRFLSQSNGVGSSTDNLPFDEHLLIR